MKKLGFGLMRLPQKGGAIDLEQTKRMADEFMARGFTYFDTAYAYAGSEAAFREAVSARYPRESYTVATKLAIWQLEEVGGPQKMFDQQLERCGVDYFDYYLLHALQPARMEAVAKWDCWSFVNRMKAEGKIKNLGFSYHGGPELLDKLLTEHPETDFVQLQLNYLDWENEVVDSEANYQVARKHNKPIVVMEPVKGGLLAGPRPEFAALGGSPASYALRWIAAKEGVMMVLSGMSDVAQMADNLNTFDELKPLSDKENAAVETVRAAMLSAPIIGCTGCGYCTKGCPMGIKIPEIFKCVNQLITFGENPRAHSQYENILAGGGARADACVACGQCEGVCPQHLGIIELLKDASQRLDH